MRNFFRKRCARKFDESRYFFSEGGGGRNLILGGATICRHTGKENLTAGVYYIGVYNIWGNTGAPEESHDTAKYSLYFNLDSAGVPCPRNHLTTAQSPGEGEFCSSPGTSADEWCNFNTGKCDCAP